MSKTIFAISSTTPDYIIGSDNRYPQLMICLIYDHFYRPIFQKNQKSKLCILKINANQLLENMGFISFCVFVSSKKGK